jgi:release factor glutamine methyltransferase
MNIKQSLVALSQRLSQAGFEQAGLEAELLLACAIQKEREFLLSYPELALNSKQKRLLNKLVKRRLAHEPMAYILGEQSFFNIKLRVDKRVLIPRPETEKLVELVLKDRPSKDATILDLGTGSGAIIITLASNLGEAHQFIATDISSKALRVARDNAKSNGQETRIEFVKSDLLKKLLRQRKWLASKNLVIVANLPYVESDWQKALTADQIKELKYEPSLALLAGEDGFDLYRQLASDLKSLIKKFDLKVRLYAEIAPTQANLFSHDFSELGAVKLERDLNGRIRIGVMKQF